MLNGGLCMLPLQHLQGARDVDAPSPLETVQTLKTWEFIQSVYEYVDAREQAGPRQEEYSFGTVSRLQPPRTISSVQYVITEEVLLQPEGIVILLRNQAS